MSVPTNRTSQAVEYLGDAHSDPQTGAAIREKYRKMEETLVMIAQTAHGETCFEPVVPCDCHVAPAQEALDFDPLK